MSLYSIVYIDSDDNTNFIGVFSSLKKVKKVVEMIYKEHEKILKNKKIFQADFTNYFISEKEFGIDIDKIDIDEVYF